MSMERMKRPEIVAHRGASGYAPESTLEAYRLAIQMSADYVEADVHMLRDGVIVAIHDADVRRTTNGKGKISDLSLAEIRGLDAGSWFNRAYPKKARPEFAALGIPTLREIIELVSTSSAGIYVEVKDPDSYPPEFETVLVALIRECRFERRTLFLSFNARSLMKIKALAPDVPTALLISRLGKDPVQAALSVHADELAIRHDLAIPPILEAAHRNGITVSVWTVDKTDDLERMIHLEVDRIITNYPDRLGRLLGYSVP
jgi:glycerophosphoryl diester phosphodiesterase